MRMWLALGPGQFYGGAFEIDAERYPFLSKPGKYRLQGVYVSQGIDAPVPHNPLRNDPERLRSLPYPGWKGEIRTNSLWIEILPLQSKK
jgi:hypothetical protein